MKCNKVMADDCAIFTTTIITGDVLCETAKYIWTWSADHLEKEGDIIKDLLAPNQN